MSGRRLAVLHHRHSFFPPDLREAIGDAAELLWVFPAGDVADEDPVRRLLSRRDAVLDLDPSDLDTAAHRLGERAPDGIITFVDDHLVLAAELAARLGLRSHTPEVARTAASKVLQRRALAAAGLPGPRFWTLPAELSDGELAARAAEIAYPAVLKPAYGSGSRGILAVDGPQALCEAYRPALEHLVEEHLPDETGRDARFGSYLSVESVVAVGVRHHLAVSGRFPLAPPFRETGNLVPAGVAPALERTLLELTDAAIAALGLVTGAVHTEIKLTPEGPRIIELNARLGGRPPFLLAEVSDVNMFRVACDVALGRPVALDGLARCRGVAYWRMLQPPLTARRVREVRGLDALDGVPHVDHVALRRLPGDPVDWREGTAGHVVSVRGVAPDREAVADTVARIDRTVEILYS